MNGVGIVADNIRTNVMLSVLMLCMVWYMTLHIIFDSYYNAQDAVCLLFPPNQSNDLEVIA